MACNCRTLLFTCNNSERLKEALKTLNKGASYYFVLYENGYVLLERASLINGTTDEIKKEKDFLICELIRLKENNEI